MIITKHGYRRIKERVGLPKRAHLRHIKSVLTNGSLSSYKKYDEFKMIYHGFLYIFKLTSHLEPVLVTTYASTNNHLSN
jgi:hypothetical protein